MPKGPKVFYLDLREGDNLMDTTAERSIVIEDAVLVWVCRKGGCVAMVDGINHTLMAGQLLVVFPGTFCRFGALSHDFEAATIVGRISPNATYNSIAKSFPKILTAPVLMLSEQENELLTSLFQYAKYSLRNHSNSHRSELDVGFMSLLHDELSDMLLRRRFEMKERSQGEQMVAMFEKMLSVSTFEHRDVDYYAEQFKLSPKRFAAIVKKVTGKTPSMMIVESLIVAAKRLLVCTDLSSSDIADKLHFTSPSFFCRYFRHYTGQTPIEWRNTHAQSHPARSAKE